MLKIGLFDQAEQPGKDKSKKLAVGDIIVEMVDQNTQHMPQPSVQLRTKAQLA